MAVRHGYWKDGKFIETKTKDEATYKWLQSKGYSTANRGLSYGKAEQERDNRNQRRSQSSSRGGAANATTQASQLASAYYDPSGSFGTTPSKPKPSWNDILDYGTPKAATSQAAPHPGLYELPKATTPGGRQISGTRGGGQSVNQTALRGMPHPGLYQQKPVLPGAEWAYNVVQATGNKIGQLFKPRETALETVQRVFREVGIEEKWKRAVKQSGERSLLGPGAIDPATGKVGSYSMDPEQTWRDIEAGVKTLTTQVGNLAAAVDPTRDYSLYDMPDTKELFEELRAGPSIADPGDATKKMTTFQGYDMPLSSYMMGKNLARYYTLQAFAYYNGGYMPWATEAGIASGANKQMVYPNYGDTPESVAAMAGDRTILPDEISPEMAYEIQKATGIDIPTFMEAYHYRYDEQSGVFVPDGYTDTTTQAYDIGGGYYYPAYGYGGGGGGGGGGGYYSPDPYSWRIRIT